MDCRETRAMLAAFHDGELSRDDRARVEEHLRDCGECEALLARLAGIDSNVDVPDPGPRYWERFNERVMERVDADKVIPIAAVRPKPAWARWRLPYLLPAVAAAALVAMVVRHSGLDPFTAAGPSAPPVAATPETAPVPAAPADRDEGERPRPQASAREKGSATGKQAPPRPGAVAPKALEKAAPAGEAQAPSPAAASPAGADQYAAPSPSVPSPVTAVRPPADFRAAPEEAVGASREKEEAAAGGRPASSVADTAPALRPPSAPPSGAAGSPAAPVLERDEIRRDRAAASGALDDRAASRADRSAETGMAGGKKVGREAKSQAAARAVAPSPCEAARSLAARERFKEAEEAQRACLGLDRSPASQEGGLVFLAELLDRQSRFAEADAVIREAQRQFPASRPLDVYLQQRPQVQNRRRAARGRSPARRPGR